METNSFALKRLKIYTGLNGVQAPVDDGKYVEETLAAMLEDAVTAVLSYCHIKKLNPALEAVAVQIAARRFKEDNEGVGTDIKAGDISISYKNPINAGCLTDMEKSVLNAYRKVKLR